MDLIERIAQAKEAADAASDKLDKIVGYIKEAHALQELLDGLIEAVKANQGRLNRIKQHDLVNAMKAANMGHFDTEDKLVKAKLDMYASGSLPKEEFDREAALEEVVRAGGQHLIKTDVTVRFPKGMDNQAKDFFARVQEILKEYDPEGEIDFDPNLVEGIHASSLQAFVKEVVKKGEQIDYEKVGCQVGQVVKFEFFEEITPGKFKKKKKISLADKDQGE